LRLEANEPAFREKEGGVMSAAEAQEVKNFLLQSDEQFRQLAEQHHQLDDRLHQLIEKHYLSDTEQFEQVTLKKKKLALKDRMESIVREYARQHSRAS
jgi:uncharacterized protein YdcH (DUF465 family)